MVACATGGLGVRGVRMMGRPLATEVGGGPIPVLGTLRRIVVVWARVVRDAVAVFLAPRPVMRRALLLCRGFVMRTRSPQRKAAFLLMIPMPYSNVRPPAI
jgi:hypothetical protein